MKCRLIPALAMILVMPGSVLATSADVNLLRQARSQAKIVAGELQQKVAAVVREEGPENAFSACRLNFAGVTDRLSDQSGWQIRRTAFRVRNPANAADDWELDVLKRFVQRQQEGVDLQTFEFAKLLSVDGRRVFRYMKPIIMQDSCLPCHGQNLSPAVVRKIKEKYPGDQATGFAAGDLRGAFSLIKILPGELP